MSTPAFSNVLHLGVIHGTEENPWVSFFFPVKSSA